MSRKPATSERGRSQTQDAGANSRLRRIQDRNWFKSSSPEPDDASTDGSQSHRAYQGSREYSESNSKRLNLQNSNRNSKIQNGLSQDMPDQCGRISRKSFHREEPSFVSDTDVRSNSLGSDVSDLKEPMLHQYDKVKSTFSHRNVGRVALEVLKRESLEETIKSPRDATLEIKPAHSANDHRIIQSTSSSSSGQVETEDLGSIRSRSPQLYHRNGFEKAGDVARLKASKLSSSNPNCQEPLDSYIFTQMDVKIDNLVSTFADRLAKKKQQQHKGGLANHKEVANYSNCLLLCKSFLCWKLKSREIVGWWTYFGWKYRTKTKILRMVAAKDKGRQGPSVSRKLNKPLRQLKEAWSESLMLSRRKASLSLTVLSWRAVSIAHKTLKKVLLRLYVKGQRGLLRRAMQAFFAGLVQNWKLAWSNNVTKKRNRTTLLECLLQWRNEIKATVGLRRKGSRFGLKRQQSRQRKLAREWALLCYERRLIRSLSRAAFRRSCVHIERKALRAWLTALNRERKPTWAQELVHPSPGQMILLRLLLVLSSCLLQTLLQYKFQCWRKLTERSSSLILRGQRFVIRRIATKAANSMHFWRKLAMRKRILGHRAWQLFFRCKNATLKKNYFTWSQKVFLRQQNNLSSQIAPFRGLYPEWIAKEAEIPNHSTTPAEISNNFLCTVKVQSQVLHNLIAEIYTAMLRRSFYFWNRMRTKRKFISRFSRWISKIEMRHRIAPAFGAWRNYLVVSHRVKSLEAKVEKCVGSRILFQAFKAVIMYANYRRSNLVSTQMMRQKLRRKNLYHLFSKWRSFFAISRYTSKIYDASSKLNRWRLDYACFMLHSWRRSLAREILA